MDITTYPVKSSSYYKEETLKKRIVIGDSYYDGALSYINLLYKGINLRQDCPHFTIDQSGKIYQHYDLIYYSDFCFDKQAINICLDNISMLKTHNGYPYSIFNKLYTGEVGDIKWKNKNLWTTYNNELILSLQSLLSYLLETFSSIEVFSQPNNIYDKEILNKSGIFYRANYDKAFYDVNPTFPFEQINKIMS